MQTSKDSTKFVEGEGMIGIIVGGAKGAEMCLDLGGGFGGAWLGGGHGGEKFGWRTER